MVFQPEVAPDPFAQRVALGGQGVEIGDPFADGFDPAPRLVRQTRHRRIAGPIRQNVGADYRPAEGAVFEQPQIALGFGQELSEETPPQRWLSLSIEDDGRGSVDRDGAGEGNRMGLIGMRERAMALGGRLDVIQLDRGFKLQAMIPFGAPPETLH